MAEQPSYLPRSCISGMWMSPKSAAMDSGAFNEAEEDEDDDEQ